MAEREIPISRAPDPNPRPGRFRPPPGAVDTHFHIFGDEAVYPMASNRSYSPPPAPIEAYDHVLETLGFERGVLVQPSVYGTDNRCSAEAMRTSRFAMRGIAVVQRDVPVAELRELHAAGFRGVRSNLLHAAWIPREDIAPLAAKLAELDWHFQLLIDVSTFEDLEGLVRRLPVPVVIDHMGHFSAAKGPNDPGFRALLRLLGEGLAWVKLSAAYRVTGRAQPPYDDVLPIARALVDANPEHCVFGTDWPHPTTNLSVPNAGVLLDMLGDWVPDEARRNRILVDNPVRLYGFDT